MSEWYDSVRFSSKEQAKIGRAKCRCPTSKRIFTETYKDGSKQYYFKLLMG